jgi:hypothetical protein
MDDLGEREAVLNIILLSRPSAAAKYAALITTASL